jgi:hypothetical protein
VIAAYRRTDLWICGGLCLCSRVDLHGSNRRRACLRSDPSCGRDRHGLYPLGLGIDAARGQCGQNRVQARTMPHGGVFSHQGCASGSAGGEGPGRHRGGSCRVAHHLCGGDVSCDGCLQDLVSASLLAEPCLCWSRRLSKTLWCSTFCYLPCQ